MGKYFTELKNEDGNLCFVSTIGYKSFEPTISEIFENEVEKKELRATAEEELSIYMKKNKDTVAMLSEFGKRMSVSELNGIAMNASPPPEGNYRWFLIDVAGHDTEETREAMNGIAEKCGLIKIDQTPFNTELDQIRRKIQMYFLSMTLTDMSRAQK